MTLHGYQDGFILIEGKEKSDSASMQHSDLVIENPYDMGAFTTILVIDKVPVWLEDHLQRLYGNADEIGVHLSDRDKKEIKGLVKKIAYINGDLEHGMRVAIWNLNPNEEFKVSRDLSINSFYPDLPSEVYDKGVITITLDFYRPRAHVKSVYAQIQEVTMQSCKKENAFEAILLDDSGRICEGSRSNVFWLRNGTVYTPFRNMLQGVTRKKIIGLCKRLEIPLEEGDYHIDDLLGADEAFLTGTTKRIIPIHSVNSKPIADGKPGETTQKLIKAYDRLVEDYIKERKRYT